MTLRSFLAKRIIYTIVLVFFVIILNFVIFEAMPGQAGVLYALLGHPGPGNDAEYRNLVAKYHLNASLADRFVTYIKNLLSFDFGYSYQYHGPVIDQIVGSGRLFNTILLLGTSTVLSIILGVVLGIIASKRRGSVFDNLSVSSSLTAYSLPVFFVGIVLIFVFAITLGWLPAGNVVPFNWGNPNIGPPESMLEQILVRLRHLFLPALTLTLITFGGFLLLTRATMLETLNEDYITTAKAKGLSERAILFRHAFKNASLPIVTAGALAFGTILSGAVITETLFNWSGLGLWLFSSVGYKDFPVMQAMFYLIALSVIIANFVSDLIYGIVDPRIRYG